MCRGNVFLLRTNNNNTHTNKQVKKCGSVLSSTLTNNTPPEIRMIQNYNMKYTNGQKAPLDHFSLAEL